MVHLRTDTSEAMSLHTADVSTFHASNGKALASATP